MAEDKEDKKWRQMILDYFRASNENQEEQVRNDRRYNKNLEDLRGIASKGNQMVMQGFSKMSGIIRDSFGPVFDLLDSGWGVVTSIYSILSGAFTFLKVIPGILGSIWKYFKRKEKREMREGGGPLAFIADVLKGIGILTLGIIGAFIMFSENVTKSFLSAFSTVGKIIKATFISPLVKFFSKFKIGRGIINIFTKIKGRFSWLGKIGKNIIKIFNNVIKHGGFVMRQAGRLGKAFTLLGGLIGKIFLPIQMAYEVIKGIFSPGTIRDKILSASAGVLSILTKIPEMIANAVLKLFGVEFRFDFGKEAIISAANKATEWAQKPIHWMLDLFTKTIPNVFAGMKEKIFGTVEKIKGLPGKFSEFFSNIVPSWDDIKSGIASNIPDWVPDWAIPKWAEGGDDKKKNLKETGEGISKLETGGVIKGEGLAYLHPAEVVVPQDLSKKLLKLIDDKGVDSMSRSEAEKIRMYQQIRDYLRNLNTLYEEQIRLFKYMSEREDEEGGSISADMRKDPPDEIENMGILLYNKSWGLG